jgi:hypothetical protein
MRTLLLLLSLGLLTGCPKRIDFGPQGQLTDPAVLLKRVEAVENQVFAVRGEAKLRADTPQGKGVVPLFAAVSHPSLLHLEALDFFGRPQSVLITDGQTFGLYQAQESKYYRGPASARNVSRFLPIALPPQELTALLLGRAPRIPAEKQELVFDEKEGAYLLTLSRASAVQKLWIDTRLHRVLRSEVRGVNAYDLRFESIDEVKGVTYPRKVELKAESSSTFLELTYKDIELNQAPDLTLFEQAPPANVPVVEVDANGELKP